MITDQVLGEALSPKKLHLIVLPTEQCNFRCTYCYEDFTVGRMRPETVKGVKALIMRRIDSLKVLSISWFGGEPLIASDIVLDIGSYAKERCFERGIVLTGHTTTNGSLLTRPLMRRLVSIGHQGFQITLDGDEEWHNKTRIRANGRGTFAKIWANLQDIRQIDEHFNISLRLHIHEENVASVRRLYERLAADVLRDRRFSVFFHRVSPLGAKPIRERELDTKRYLDAIAYITNGASLSASPASGMSERHLEGYVCYAAKPNSLMIRANGRLGKCTVALSDERNDIGYLKDDGSLEISNEKLRLWFEGYTDMSESVLGCPATALRSLKGVPIRNVADDRQARAVL